MSSSLLSRLFFSSTLIAPTRSLVCGARAANLFVPPVALRVHGIASSAGRRASRKARGVARAPQEPATPAAFLATQANASAAAIGLSEPPTDAAGFTERAAHFGKLRQPHKAVELYDRAAAQRAELGREVLPSVIRALLKMRRVDIALELHRRHSADQPGCADPTSTVTLFLALCRTNQLDEAVALLAELELAYPAPADEGAAAASSAPRADGDDEPMWHAIGSAMAPGLTMAHLDANEPHRAVRLARRLARQPACLPPPHMLTKLMRGFGKAKSLRGVYACLDAIAAAPEPPEPECLQTITDAIVHSVEFVKGGVSMDTLPRSGMDEVAFIGRSNVGKSSLVNMVLGRRAIAYTSKKPGKTQQYNYFVLNEAREGVADGGAFHLVDMPGLGYAKVPGAERKKWLAFLKRYAAERPQLRLLVHLVDGQVGVTSTDEAIMRMVRDAHAAASGAAPAAPGGGEGEDGAEAAAADGAEAAAMDGAEAAEAAEPRECPWQYAVVLTKADKGGSKAFERSVAGVRSAIEAEGCPPPAAIVATSARDKFGRDAMWRMLRPVALSPKRPSHSDAD